VKESAAKKAPPAKKAQKAAKGTPGAAALATAGQHLGSREASPLGSRPGLLQRPRPVERRSEGYTDERFLSRQSQLLEKERATYVEQAQSLQAEAEQLVAEMEPGDVQFDDESGEGGTLTVDRERDLALSAQAMQAVQEIDDALEKMRNRIYGICENCGRLITKPRLEALPFARLCIDCKSGGLSRR
jgi:DnaK suppressor protein